MDIFENIKDKDILLSNIKLITKKYKKGDIIFNENDICFYLSYVKKGHITAKLSLPKGKDCIVRVLNEGEYIGINLLFSSNPKYKASFIADNDVILELINKDDLLSLLLNNKKILENTLSIISDFGIVQNEHIKLLSRKTIRSKICYILYKKYKETSKLKFILEYNKTNLSSLLNVERESLSLEIKKMCDDNIIKNNRNEYEIINLDKIIDEI